MKHKLKCLFTSDLHGNESKYDRLFDYIEKFSPDAIFLGGDLTSPVMRIRGRNTSDGINCSWTKSRAAEQKKGKTGTIPSDDS